MRKVIVILLAILFFLVCVLLAFFSDKNPFATPVTPSLPTKPGAIQRTILLIQTDDLPSESPKLASFWVMSYLSDPAQMNLVMLYPTADSDGRALDLAKEFGLDSEGRLSAEFRAAIAAYKFSYEAYFLIDSAGLVQAINLVDNSLKVTPRGKTLVAGLVMPWDNVDSSIKLQQSLATDICDALTKVPYHLNVNYLWNNTMPSHLRTDITVEAWASLWHLVMSKKERFSCKILAPQ